MYLIALLFLGIAAFDIAAVACLLKGKRATKRIEVDIDALHAASKCISGGRRAGDSGAAKPEDPTLNEKERWHELKVVWMKWYARCREEAIVKQKAMLSWARTCALCSVLCLVGVLLEVEFGEHISMDAIVQNFEQSYSVATISHPKHVLHRLDLPVPRPRSPR
jgi:hypothetical protein